MEELREEVGVNEIFTRKLVRRRSKSVGQVDRLGRDRLTQRADALIVKGRRRR